MTEEICADVGGSDMGRGGGWFLGGEREKALEIWANIPCLELLDDDEDVDMGADGVPICMELTLTPVTTGEPGPSSVDVVVAPISRKSHFLKVFDEYFLVESSSFMPCVGGNEEECVDPKPKEPKWPPNGAILGDFDRTGERKGGEGSVVENSCLKVELLDDGDEELGEKIRRMFWQVTESRKKKIRKKQIRKVSDCFDVVKI